MAYKLVYTRTAARDIDKLDAVIKKKLSKKLTEYSKNPHHYAKKLISKEIGTYRWRIGDFRVVFDIDTHKIVILRVGHRREIYK